MNYFVKRGDQTFGPYTLADLQQYVQTGNVAPGDLAQSEGMNEWIPVFQVLGNIPVAAPATPVTTAAQVQLVSLPPNLHWGLLLLIDILTRQIFNFIWALVQANWARKLIGNNRPMVLVAMYPAGFIAGIFAAAVGAGLGQQQLAPVFAGICIVGGLIAYLVGIFSIRSAMEDYYNSKENIGLSLSGVMTFFFSTIYFQYHINKIARWKKTGVYA